jgi:hypothetical protein
MGCPVVSTTLGIAGLPLVSGRHCLVADTADSFANAVLRMLGDVTSRRVIAENARRLVEQNFSACTAAAVFEDACWRAITLAEARHSNSAQGSNGGGSSTTDDRAYPEQRITFLRSGRRGEQRRRSARP